MGSEQDRGQAHVEIRCVVWNEQKRRKKSGRRELNRRGEMGGRISIRKRVSSSEGEFVGIRGQSGRGERTRRTEECGQAGTGQKRGEVAEAGWHSISSCRGRRSTDWVQNKQAAASEETGRGPAAARNGRMAALTAVQC